MKSPEQSPKRGLAVNSSVARQGQPPSGDDISPPWIDEEARKLLFSICGTTIDEELGTELIRRALRRAFDLGFRAGQKP
jgi:hypothetical protein